MLIKHYKELCEVSEDELGQSFTHGQALLDKKVEKAQYIKVDEDFKQQTSQSESETEPMVCSESMTEIQKMENDVAQEDRFADPSPYLDTAGNGVEKLYQTEPKHE